MEPAPRFFWLDRLPYDSIRFLFVRCLAVRFSATHPATARSSDGFIDRIPIRLVEFDPAGITNPLSIENKLAAIRGEQFHVVKTDCGTPEYVAKLTHMHAQFRASGVNYNQVVKTLLSHFSERRTMAMLYKLEQETMKLVATNEQIIALTKEFEQKFP